jgi:serine/threonine-protein kinase
LVNDASGARYVRTGHLIYLRGTTLFAAPFDPRRLELTGPAIPVVEGVSDSASAVGEYSFSDSGLLVYMKGAGVNEKTILAWADRKGAMEPFTAAEYWGTGRLSPDGRLVANQIYTSKAPEGDIWIYDVARRSKTRLTFGGTNQYPIWTPDGGRVTFSATAAGKHGIYSAPADGSEKPLLLLETEDRARPTSWSPDGKALVYSMPGKDPPVPRLWVLPVTLPARPEGAPALSPANRYKFQRPGQPYRLHDTPFSEDEGEVSPDGHWLAYTSVESGSPEVYVQPFPGPGGKERISTEGGQAPRWSRNGRELFYLDSTSSRVMSVDIRTTPQFHAGIPTRLFAQRGSSTWDVAPDGNRFLFEQFPAGETGSREMQVVVDWFEELRRRVPAGK